MTCLIDKPKELGKFFVGFIIVGKQLERIISYGKVGKHTSNAGSALKL